MLNIIDDDARARFKGRSCWCDAGLRRQHIVQLFPIFPVRPDMGDRLKAPLFEGSISDPCPYGSAFSAAILLTVSNRVGMWRFAQSPDSRRSAPTALRFSLAIWASFVLHARWLIHRNNKYAHSEGMGECKLEPCFAAIGIRKSARTQESWANRSVMQRFALAAEHLGRFDTGGISP